MKNLSKLLPTLNKKLVIPVVSVMMLFAFVAYVTFEATESAVEVTANGEKQTVNTHAETVADLMQELEINVGEHDALSHKTTELITNDMEIVYEKAKEIVLTVDGDATTYYTTEDTVATFLKDENITVEKHDELSVDASKTIEDGLDITLEKASKVTLNDGGEEKEVWTTTATVEDLLSSQSITLNELDRIEPKETERVTDEMTVTITRVEKVTEVVEEKTDYATVKKNDQSLKKGTEQVVKSGEKGLIEKEYEVTLENGEEVDRELISENVKKESKDRVVAVGTKVIQNTATNTVSRGDSKTKKTLYMHATAYNWDCRTCSGSGRTATGYNLKENPNGVIAVDPNVIPLGTKVYVEGYGYAVARDTGGNIKGNRIDVHLPSLAAAMRYGWKRVKVEILE
ncbi:Cell wall-binding protein YocH precursor [Paraliobacillus sp. PM-2]|uniref:ubiquitin-like domain-containing protein n=1 Tax=Paraliobacillus sp. PM-2 TaxID=1462524 RepID=UPI00061CB6B9|nr:ubiquitin-like domain-containing protein [Paraliobacillus sp. PM-2]CQR47493.1 Cell wall-binding protein YocH precursor [Paraliobacillus sp. PM-2]